MERFLSKKALPDNLKLSSLFIVDIDKLSDQLPIDKVFIGYSAKTQLAMSEVTGEKETNFRMECVLCYKTLINKLRERSPLQYEFIRQICCLNPNYISSHPNSSISKFENILTIMLGNNYLKGDECDELRTQFKDFIKLSRVEYPTNFAKYDALSDRLDDFFLVLLA